MTSAENNQTEVEILTFEDDAGREYEARLLAQFEVEHKKYALLKEEPPPEDGSDPIMIIMRILMEDESGGTVYLAIEDESELSRVQHHIYNALLEVESELYSPPDDSRPRRSH
jgi:uncharacterized protein YrzB (UPF0473 family)